MRHLPGFGELEHVGRRSGRTYATPLLAFRHGDRLTFAITYGRSSDWVLNVIATGGGTFRGSRDTWVLSEPRLYRDPARRAVPWFVRPPLRMLGVADFLESRAVRADATGPKPR